MKSLDSRIQGSGYMMMRHESLHALWHPCPVAVAQLFNLWPVTGSPPRGCGFDPDRGQEEGTRDIPRDSIQGHHVCTPRP